MNKVWKRFWTLVLVLSFLFGFGDITAKADVVDPYVYVDENFKVTYIVNGAWDNSVTATIEIENIGSETIKNWFLGMALDGEIEEIWNATIYRHVKEHYVIKNANYNSNIAPGERVSFGCVIKFSDTERFPDEFYMPVTTQAVRSRRYEVRTEIVSSWEGGQEYQITVQNISKQTIEDWTVEFDFDAEINSLWNSLLVSEENGHYILTNNNYNNTIVPGGSVSFGFLVNGSTSFYPENIVLNEITSDGIKIAEKLVDARNFANFDIVTEEYEVTPLYTIDGRISAYLVQYYDNGEATGYIVVSNEVDCLDYYIEFGYGIPDMVWSMVDAVKDECGKPVDRIIYVGGYTYYALVEDTIYMANTGKAYPVTENEELRLAAAGDELRYYEHNVTLTLAMIYAKEVGYANVSSKNAPSIPTLSTFKYMTNTETAYRKQRGKSITNHCSPTAGLNMLFYLAKRGYSTLSLDGENWEKAFCRLYDDMGTNDTTGTLDSKVETTFINLLSAYGEYHVERVPSIPWYTATWHLDKWAMLFSLQGSQIYDNHMVLGIGYCQFSFTSGWISKYFRIIDGWEPRDGGSIDRYVNYSLGIDHINGFIIEPMDGIITKVLEKSE